MRSRTDLWSYQQRAVEFVKQHERCALWVDMGLGKTVSTLTAFGDLLKSFDARRALVVAPLRVARQVWSDEVQEWSHLHGLTVSRAVGTEAERIAALRRPADLYTLGRENVPWLHSLFIDGKKQVRRFPWDTIILDESQSFKSQSAKRWKCMRQLRRLAPRMIQLTGTPIPNGYVDLWAQLLLLDRGARLGVTEKSFRDRWFEPPQEMYGRWTLKEHAAAEIQRLVSDIVLTMRAEDYLSLPPVHYNQVRVRLLPAEAQQYRRFERLGLLELQEKTITAANAGVAWQKLLQYANGAIYTDDKGAWKLIHNAKLDALMEILDGVSGPTLIAYNFRSDLERIKAAMPVLCGSQRTWDVLDSEASITRWNLGLTDYLILHPKSAGHGLNLQKSGAETIVWFGLGPSLELYEQLNARLIGGHRAIGKNVVIHHILADGTVDDDALDLIQQKDKTQRDLKAALVRRMKDVL